MASSCSWSSLHIRSPFPPLTRLSHSNLSSKLPSKLFNSNSNRRPEQTIMLPTISAVSGPQLGPVFQELVSGFQTSPATWNSSILCNFVIFTLGSPLLVAGLSAPGIASAFLLGTLTWRSFGSSGFLLVAAYFVIGTAVTKVKMAQKEAQGVAERRKGRRGPGSVIGSSAAGCVCALVSIYGAPTDVVSHLLKLGFVASFCTKLSDTVSSEIGKAYGKITYLVTTLKVVPRGTEGAVSLEGTLAGLVAAALLAYVGCYLKLIKPPEAMVCIIASQIANVGESIIGATLQEKEGFKWLNNDLVNVINISMGSIVAVMIQQLLLGSNLKVIHNTLANP